MRAPETISEHARFNSKAWKQNHLPGNLGLIWRFEGSVLWRLCTGTYVSCLVSGYRGLCLTVYRFFQSDCKYSLYAVVVHYGGTMFGHYTAYVRDRVDKRWHYADDSHVEQVCPTKTSVSLEWKLFLGSTWFWNQFMTIGKGRNIESFGLALTINSDSPHFCSCGTNLPFAPLLSWTRPGDQFFSFGPLLEVSLVQYTWFKWMDHHQLVTKGLHMSINGPLVWSRCVRTFKSVGQALRALPKMLHLNLERALCSFLTENHGLRDGGADSRTSSESWRPRLSDPNRTTSSCKKQWWSPETQHIKMSSDSWLHREILSIKVLNLSLNGVSTLSLGMNLVYYHQRRPAIHPNANISHHLICCLFHFTAVTQLFPYCLIVFFFLFHSFP